MNHWRHVTGREACAARNPDMCWWLRKRVRVRLCGDCSSRKGRFGRNILIDGQKKKATLLFKPDESKSRGVSFKVTNKFTKDFAHVSRGCKSVCLIMHQLARLLFCVSKIRQSSPAQSLKPRLLYSTHAWQEEVLNTHAHMQSGLACRILNQLWMFLEEGGAHSQ